MVTAKVTGFPFNGYVKLPHSPNCSRVWFCYNYIALFKNGELVHFIERHHIEGRPAEMIAEHLVDVFEEYC